MGVQRSVEDFEPIQVLGAVPDQVLGVAPVQVLGVEPGQGELQAN